ncbi:unnamed protein product [Aureobasidium uvarum]|uniref:Uncharacterized protein n=1 Tax=Aureobasidium uvarum TaxID=2773716 RepID=A0A9N8KDU4_9PEZI|nr:unnamed protein product [Aureobasidium uvarum]
MHFTKTIAAVVALTATVSALPLQKRGDDVVVGNPANPLDDLLTNIKGGLEGGLDFLSLPSGDGANNVKRAEEIPDAANPLVDLVANVKGGAEGFFDFLGAPSGNVE